MQYLYSFIMYVLSPFFIIRLKWKARKMPAYGERWQERFCWDKSLTKQYDVWIHAVSLGETIAISPLIEKLLTEQYKLLITTMTPTGAERVIKQFGQRLTHRYVPYDLPDVLNRFFRTNQIRLGLIVETELWPNLLVNAHKNSVPLLLVNGRLSERSFKNYQKLDFFFKPLLNQFQAIFTQAEPDAKRFIQLGASDDSVEVAGNIKFDLTIDKINTSIFASLKQHWGKDRPVLIIASTHDNEEQVILAQLKNLKETIPELIVLIAPRHPERFQKVYQLTQQMGFKTGLRSQIDTINLHAEVIVLDCLGELLGFYSVSDYAFVGGSFAPIGGHNVLEPIAMNVPVLTGPHVFNFKSICNELIAAHAIKMVANAEELIKEVALLYNNPSKREKMVLDAKQILDINKGALDFYLEKINTLLK